MTLLIAHRGLTNGSYGLENYPDNIKSAIDNGYDAEIDVRYVDGEWFLGHDYAIHHVSLEWLLSLKDHLWIHAKNIDTLYELTKMSWDGNFFFHENDQATLTSKGFIWTYPRQQLTQNSIMLMPEWSGDITKCVPTNCYGICSDFVEQIRHLLIR